MMKLGKLAVFFVLAAVTALAAGCGRDGDRGGNGFGTDRISCPRGRRGVI